MNWGCLGPDGMSNGSLVGCLGVGYGGPDEALLNAINRQPGMMENIEEVDNFEHEVCVENVQTRCE